MISSTAVFAHPAVWRANQLGSSAARGMPTQFAALDRELPESGWPLSNLIELLIQHDGIGEMRLLAPALARLSQDGKTVMMIAPPAIPYPPALVKHGVLLDRLIVVSAGQRTDCLWAIEQALKSASLGALIAWLPEEHRALAIDQLRRLQLAAQSSPALAFMFRPIAVQTIASPAPLRIALAPSAADRLLLNIFKRRGPPASAPIAIDLTPATPSRQMRSPAHWTQRADSIESPAARAV